jgi:hypothetical protein
MKKIILLFISFSFYLFSFSQRTYKIFRSIPNQYDNKLKTWIGISEKESFDTTLFSFSIDTLDLHLVKNIIVNNKGEKRVFECPPISEHFINNNFNIFIYYNVRLKGTKKTCTIQFEQQPNDGRSILDIFYDDDTEVGYALFYNAKQ